MAHLYLTIQKIADKHPMRPTYALIFRGLLALGLSLSITACEIPGMGPDPKEMQRIQESKAIGGACRHALKGVEDCYLLNEKALKAAIFEGWKEMDAYMRENKIEGQKTTVVIEEVIKPEPPKPAEPEPEPEPKKGRRSR
jgi:hypothetical protein